MWHLARPGVAWVARSAATIAAPRRPPPRRRLWAWEGKPGSRRASQGGAPPPPRTLPALSAGAFSDGRCARRARDPPRAPKGGCLRGIRRVGGDPPLACPCQHGAAFRTHLQGRSRVPAPYRLSFLSFVLLETFVATRPRTDTGGALFRVHSTCTVWYEQATAPLQLLRPFTLYADSCLAAIRRSHRPRLPPHPGARRPTRWNGCARVRREREAPLQSPPLHLRSIGGAGSCPGAR